MKNNHVNTCIYKSVLPLFIGAYFFLQPLFSHRPKNENGISPPGEVQQTYMIRGTVTDVYGPISGVNITVFGTQNGTFSDSEGKYGLEVSPSDTLVFSYLGYTTLKIPVHGQKQLNVQLQSEVTSLQEVEVNAGYYTVKERERTGSIAKIAAKDIEKQPVSNPLAAMQGRMPGVNVVQNSGVPGSSYSILIRGRNSINEGSTPLFIVDGVPYDSESLGSGLVSAAIIPLGSSPFNTLNPGDIQSIEVLRDADATAIYGSRGANGVVLITTKQGREGKTQVHISLSSSLGKITRFFKLMNTQQYLEMRKEAFANDGIENYPQNAYDINGVWNQNRNTNWQKELIGGTAFRNNSQISFSGGSHMTKFLLSGGYQKETTVFPGGSKYGKASVHARLSHQSKNNRLKVNFSTAYVADDNQLPGSDFTTQAYFLPPNAPKLYQEDGQLNWENGTWTNPLSILKEEYRSQSNNLIANTVITFQPIINLELKTSLGYNDFHFEEYRTSPSTRFNPAFGLDSRASAFYDNQGSHGSWIIEPQVNWKHHWNQTSLKVTLGGTWQQRNSQKFSQLAFGYPSNALLFDLSAASTRLIRENDDTTYKYQAIFGRININWKEQCILNLTGRRDGSSRFGPGGRFGNFGAIGAAWLFSKMEGLQEKIPSLSFGKLRASYGITGSDNIGDYNYLDTYGTSGQNYNGVTGLRPTHLFNPNFGWEENQKMEGAMELGFWKDRLLLSIAWYRNISSNQLVGIPLPGTTGFSSLTSNFDATVENTGTEITLRTTTVQNDHFLWTTSFNMSVPRNKLVKFPGLESSTFSNSLMVGKSLDIRKLYNFTGLGTDGVYEFQDYNNDGNVSSPEDRQWIEDTAPNYYGGLENTFTYKNWELSFFFQFKKQKGLNYLVAQILPGTMVNQPVSVLDRWQQSGDNARIQRYTTGINTSASTAFSRYSSSSAAYTDASFIRLRNISLTYSLPKDLLGGIKSNVYLQGQNLWTITSFNGADPDQPFGLRLPPLRQLTLGIQLIF